MATPESKVKEKVKAYLKSRGAYQHWPVLNGMGAPELDCTACYRGRYFSIETKAPGQKPTRRQEQTIAAKREAGAEVFVVDGAESLAAVALWMDEIDNFLAD